jgi:hypothetical protein
MTSENLTAEKTIFWLQKTVRSASKITVSDFETNYRGNELATRYNDLIERAQKLGIWEMYCESNNFSTDHDGHDLFA